jgi:hypothetical protein
MMSRSMMALRHAGIRWPDGKSFAFTMFDDTDNATVENSRPVYILLNELGIKITKSVWPLRSDPADIFFAQSLQDDDYLDFVLELKEKGFEIGYHGARGGSNPRHISLEALDLFREKIGHDPCTYAHHAPALENLYWGRSRTQWPLLGRLAEYCSQHAKFYGSDPNSIYFWGDLCKTRIKYVRNYGFSSANLLQCDPWTPYHDPQKPFVNCWFSTNGWLNANSIEEVLNPARFDQWEESGGLVVMGGHLGQNFSHDGKVIDRVERTMRLLAERNGWFVPVGTLLDYICAQRGVHVLTSGQSRMLELRWAMHMGIKTLRSRL